MPVAYLQDDVMFQVRRLCSRGVCPHVLIAVCLPTQRFVDEDVPGAQYKKTFQDINTMRDYWDWVFGVLAPGQCSAAHGSSHCIYRRCRVCPPGLYPTEWYNDDPFTEAQLGNVQLYNQLVGPIELRQMRVSNNSCHERRFLQYGHK